MRALRMEPLENSVDKVLPLVAPFVEIQTEKRRLPVSKGFPAGFALVLASRCVRHKQVGYFVEKGLESLGGHPKPAIRGHLKTGQRDS